MPQVLAGYGGVDFTKVKAGTGTNSDQGADFKLGTMMTAGDGGCYMYVHGAAAVAQYDCVAIDEDFEVTPADSGTVDTNSIIGFAQVAIANNEFGWVAIEGTNINCRIITGTSADVALYADSRTSLAGQLQALTSLGALLLGVRPVAASNTSVSVNPEVSARNVVVYAAT